MKNLPLLPALFVLSMGTPLAAALETIRVPDDLEVSLAAYQLGGEGDAITGPFRFVAAALDAVRIASEAFGPDQFLRKGTAPAEIASDRGTAHPGSLDYLTTRLTYYPDHTFPKLTTPMWIGEPGVTAAIILAIDDMRDIPKYVRHLAPIQAKLKEVTGGQSPLSIMTHPVDPKHPALAQWLSEGLTIEAHTKTHPCPLLKDGDLERAYLDVAASTDALAMIPGNKPVAFRMPCCDSANTVSPRFYSEIFSRPSPGGHVLDIDSSIFCLLTPDDPEIPRELVANRGGESRFGRYVAIPEYVNYIENYPYPYLICNTVWEFPCTVPSDWEAQRINGKKASRTVADCKAALDAVVLKQGVFTLCFHPHGWLGADQVIDIIGHAVKRYGKRITFLNFRDASERLTHYLTGGVSVHDAAGRDRGVRLVDLNTDGYLDVIVGPSSGPLETRIWDPKTLRWRTTTFPHPLITSRGGLENRGGPAGVTFARVRKNGWLSILVRTEKTAAGYHFTGDGWSKPIALTDLFADGGTDVYTALGGRDRGVRGVDLNADGYTDLVVNNERQNRTFLWNRERAKWCPAAMRLPATGSITDATGLDRGHRFVDINGDGFLDSVTSNEARYAVSIYDEKLPGWGPPVIAGTRAPGEPNPVPPIVEKERLSGAWFRYGTMYMVNERTDQKPGHLITYTLPLVPRTAPSGEKKSSEGK